MLNPNFSNIKISRHPLHWVAQVITYYINSNMLDASATLVFSKYKYRPQTYEDKREIFNLSVYSLNEGSFLQMLMDLESGEEVACHSQVLSMGKNYHLPMIDFGYKGMSPGESESLRELCSHWNIDFNIYTSGRSYHAYGNRLLTESDWVKFMGSLLLMNKPSGFKLIDERWVGHRLMAGYSALRWSKNSSHYKKYPTQSGYISARQVVIDSMNEFPTPPPTLRGPGPRF